MACRVELAVFILAFAAGQAYGGLNDLHIIEHAVDLNTVTFDKCVVSSLLAAVNTGRILGLANMWRKIISHQNVTVVMFVRHGSYEPKRREFSRFAESTQTQPEVLAATVGVINMYEMDNWDLAVRFNIAMDQLPLVKLFAQGVEVATLKDDITNENLRQLVIGKTGLWIGRAGTLQHLDELVGRFMTAGNRDDKEQLIQTVREFKEKKATEDEHVKSATYYIRLFEEYMKQGPTFLGMESGRLKALMAKHKHHNPSVCGIRKQQNILETFQRSQTLAPPHDEL